MKYWRNAILMALLMAFSTFSFAQQTAQEQRPQADALSELETQFETIMKSATSLVEHAKELRKLERELIKEKGIEKGRASYVENMGGEEKVAAIEAWTNDVIFGLGIKVSFVGFLVQVIEADGATKEMTKLGLTHKPQT